MKAKVEVNNRRQGELIKAGLEVEAARILSEIIGALSLLESNRARLRMLEFVRDFYVEQDERSAQQDRNSGQYTGSGESPAAPVSVGYTPESPT